MNTLGQHKMEQATAESWSGGMTAGREPRSSFYSLGISAFSSSTAAGEETHTRQEQTKPGPSLFQSKMCGLVTTRVNASKQGK